MVWIIVCVNKSQPKTVVVPHFPTIASYDAFIYAPFVWRLQCCCFEKCFWIIDGYFLFDLFKQYLALFLEGDGREYVSVIQFEDSIDDTPATEATVIIGSMQYFFAAKLNLISFMSKCSCLTLQPSLGILQLYLFLPVALAITKI